MNDDIALKRLYWHSRRGMLELDCLLVPFTEQAYITLNHTEQNLYQKLLSYEDQDLFAWFMGHKSAPAHLIPIIDMVLKHGKS